MFRLIASALLLDFVSRVYGVGYEMYDNYGHTEECQEKIIQCDVTEVYQSFDGTCNNAENPTWGAANTVLPRLLPAEYSDGRGSPRTTGVFTKLPSTRKVSNALKETRREFSSGVSHLHVVFGQLLAHDIVHTPVVKNSDGSKLDCNCANPHKDCFNIEIPRDDEQFLKTLKTCMGMQRSKPAAGKNGCKFFKRSQFNAMSSFIDGTFIYGKTEQEALELRDLHSYGELKMAKNPVHGSLKNLPNQKDLEHTNIAKTIDCPAKVHKPVDVPCFVAGDVRANENPGLQAIQTIMTRYHNQIARELKIFNPLWDGNRIFKVARRIISALVQSITYSEYLPPLLGPTWIKRFGLQLSKTGYWNGYDSRYHPSITNEFTTAAFRYGHSQVAERMSRPGAFFRQTGLREVKSEGTFFDNGPLLEATGGGSGSFMRGFMVDNAEKTDVAFVDALRNQLLTERGKSFGGDLMAINTQRGRDHGLPGYNKYRELCGLTRVTSFEDLASEIPTSTIRKLRGVYNSVEDIDLYIGGLAENHVEGGEVGPTFACILAYGFRALRKGDRFWFEYENSPTQLTPQQLHAIRQTTFARILCDAGEDMKYVFKYPMLMSQRQRRSVAACGNIPKLDLSHWRDHSGFYQSYDTLGSTEWTPWFVTTYQNEFQVDVGTIKFRLEEKRNGEFCQNHVKHQTRKVPGDAYLQIRFSCQVGRIEATDFPFQVGENHYWSRWVTNKGFEVGSQMVNIADFDCDDVVAIQAKSRTSNLFARETGEVFERFHHRTGFTCRDKHQVDGACETYLVRALCLRRLPSNHRTTALPPPPRSTQSSNVYQFWPSASQPGTSYHVPPVAMSAQNPMVSLFCTYYNICCDASKSNPGPNVPVHIMEFAAYLCMSENVCCNL